MGGIGKTQTAIEYAYRYREKYSHVFFINAATADALLSGCVAVASLLYLPEVEQQDQNVVVDAVRYWLSAHSEWLLIVDNVDDLEVVRAWLPASGHGHTILTIRTSALGDVAEPVVIEQFQAEDGALLLLRRARKIGTNGTLDVALSADIEVALAISNEVDGLPLALDQAGAYIEETSCSLIEYLHLYKDKGQELRAMRGNISNHASISVTFALAFQQVEETSPATAELLRICAFLAPDDIPEEMLTAGADIVGDAFSGAVSDAIGFGKVLRVGIHSALLSRNGMAATISIHRVVQEVLKDQFSPGEQLELAERAIKVVHAGLIHHQWLSTKSLSTEAIAHGRLIAQEIRCHDLANAYNIVTFEVARVLYNSAVHLMHHALYMMAEPLLAKSLDVMLNCSETIPMSIAHNLNDLARVRHYIGERNNIATIYQQAIAIAEEEMGLEDVHVGIFLDNLATHYYSVNLFDKALEASQKAFAILQKTIGPSHRDIAISLNNLSALHLGNGQEAEAEQLLLQSEAMMNDLFGVDYYELALPLMNRASLLMEQERYNEAELLLKKCVSVTETKFGENSARLALGLNRLAYLYMQQHNLVGAELVYKRVLTIIEKTQGAGFRDIVEALNNIAVIIQRQDRHDEAAELLTHALNIREYYLGEDDPETAQSYKNLGVSYFFLGRYAEAEDLYKKSLNIREKVYGPESIFVDMVLTDYIDLLFETGREEEAKAMIERSDVIRVKHNATHDGTDSTGKKEPSP